MTAAGCGSSDFDLPFTNMPDGFTITAHTGCMQTAENSLESIKKGAENGAHIVEFDLRFYDSVPYLSHDYIKSTNRLVSFAWRIATR